MRFFLPCSLALIGLGGVCFGLWALSKSVGAVGWASLCLGIVFMACALDNLRAVKRGGR